MATSNSAKMIGHLGRFPCGCCTDDTKVKVRRANKRREKVQVRREIRLEMQAA